ncbi:hypothetical protein JCM9743_30140 [Natrinema sp. JCM 9743]
MDAEKQANRRADGGEDPSAVVHGAAFAPRSYWPFHFEAAEKRASDAGPSAVGSGRYRAYSVDPTSDGRWTPSSGVTAR